MRADRRGPASRLVIDPMAQFVRQESAGGIVLLVAAAGALAWANAAPGGYTAFWQHELAVGSGALRLELDLRHWINDALMTIFFFVVGLEIKRELVVGRLRDRRAVALPVLAAVGGAALPILLFTVMTAGTPMAAGWAIPAATDIAFAVGVLALFGDRVSAGIKLFLLTVAIVDDIFAITIIAVFYAHGVSTLWLLASAAAIGGVLALRAAGVTAITAYVVLGAVLWVVVHESGVHATIAGVVLGLLTPAAAVRGRPVLVALQQRLHPVSGLLIVPLFALANAGVDFGGGVLAEAAGNRLAWAIALGLVVGKVLGIAGATFLGLRLGWGALPAGVPRRQVWGMAALGGIGFTVSLFIAQLAYSDPGVVGIAKVGILAGSLMSAALGTGLLLRQTTGRAHAGPDRGAPRANVQPTDRPAGATTHR